MTFTHDGSGTDEATWVASAVLERLPHLDLAGVRAVVVVAAHPDDETLGAGGLIEQCARRSIEVEVLVATDGEASHPGSPTVSATQLGAVRRREVLDAVGTLAPLAAVRLLGLGDGALAGAENELAGVLTQRLQAHKRAAGAGSVLLVAPWRHDGHPDHEAAGRVCADVAREVDVSLCEYPIWGWHWASTDDPRLPWPAARRLTIDDAGRTRKGSAMNAHRSQTRPLSALPGDETMLSSSFLDHFRRPVEVFFVDEFGSERPQPADSLTAGYFEEFYTHNGPDPWGFIDRWYERRKRAVTLASLPRERFATAWELGCSIGVLTEALAGRCGHLVATDVADAAVSASRSRLADVAHVEVRHVGVDEWPEETFELVVASEVGYYRSAQELAGWCRRLAAAVGEGGVLVACHWRHHVDEYPVTGDDVHAALAGVSGLGRVVRHLEEDFVLDVLMRPPGLSVARSGGLVP